MRRKQYRRRTHRMKSFIFLLLLGLIAIGIYNFTRPLPKLQAVDFTPTPTAAKNAPALNWPNSGEAAIGAVGYGVLAEHGTMVARPTASTAKLITALTVLKKYPLSLGEQSTPVITLGAADVALYNKYYQEDGSLVRVASGEQISEYQALQAMLLPSANNMADSLAIWAYGSLDQYRAAATAMVHSMGLADTVVGPDASGFLPGTTSTAHDLTLLGIAAMQNPVLAQIVSQSQANLPVAGIVHNVNWLLGEDGIVGVKTGDTDQAGGVYIFAAPDQLDSTHRVMIVGAVQDMPTLQNALDAAVPLLNSAKNNLSVTASLHTGSPVAQYHVPWSKPVDAVAHNNLSSLVWAGHISQPTVKLDNLNAPLPAGAHVGTVTSASLDQTSVVLKEPISGPPWWWRITRHTF